MIQEVVSNPLHSIEQLSTQASETPLLHLEDMTVDFKSLHGTVRVLHGVNLEVRAGEILGLVGESGSGKSVTCLASIRLLGPTATISGRIDFDGVDVLSLKKQNLTNRRGSGIAMIFQDPMSSLNPVRSIGWQLAESLMFNTNGRNKKGHLDRQILRSLRTPGRGHLDRQILRSLKTHRGLTGNEARQEVIRLLECVGIPDQEQRMREYPHQLSGGMNQRAMIAMALAGQPRLLIADEPTTALDVTIQAQILELLRHLRDEFGMGIILITHDLGVVADVCEQIAVMYTGRIVEHGPVQEVFRTPLHPYTRGLLASLPRLDREIEKIVPIKGTVPAPHELPPGCPFAPRCPDAQAICSETAPQYCQIDEERGTACFFAPGHVVGQH